LKRAGELSVGLKEGAHGRAIITDSEIKARIDERNEARRRKDFVKADQIRAELNKEGITIEDRPDGTSRWKR